MRISKQRPSCLYSPLLALLSFAFALVACTPSSTISIAPAATVTPTVSGTQLSGCNAVSTSSSGSQAQVKNQTLYVGVSKFDTPPLHTAVYALDAQSGATQWSNILVHTGYSTSYQFLQVVGGVAYVAYAGAHSTSYTDTVDALSAKDGSMLWHYQVNDRYEDIHTMVICNGIVYLGITRFGPGAVAGTASIVEALQAKDAKPLWRYSSNDSSYDDTGPIKMWCAPNASSVPALFATSGIITVNSLQRDCIDRASRTATSPSPPGVFRSRCRFKAGSASCSSSSHSVTLYPKIMSLTTMSRHSNRSS